MSCRGRFWAARVAIAMFLATGLLLLRADSSRAVEFLVDNNNDAGPGTLRQAILDANASPGADTILIAIEAPAGPVRINLETALPAITDTVTIDATGQPGFTVGHPQVEVAGPLFFDSSSGLSLPEVPGLVFDTGSDGSMVRGLSLVQFTMAVVLTSDGNTVQDNWIGVGADGSAQPNNIGVQVDGATNTIGPGNVISGNYGDGVTINGNDNVVAGNVIGLDPTGTTPQSNGVSGVSLHGSAGGNVVGGTDRLDRNLIGGNGDGVVSDATGTGNSIVGNFIGTDVTGTLALGNSDGVRVVGTAIQIGGTAPGAGNLISGNISFGIDLTNADGTIVEGNRVGPDVTGDVALGNDFGGVVVSNSSDVVIGGAGAGNQISGNGGQVPGVGIRVTNVTGLRILGNLIGTTSTGGAALPNSYGITLLGTSDVVIGGTTAGAANVISGNQSTGVSLDCGEVAPTLTTIQGNRIGTDAGGGKAVANGFAGIVVNCSAGTLVGGTSAGAGNVISGNGAYGVLDGASGDLVQGNRIGVDVNGGALGNGSTGVYIASTDPEVGGSTPAAGNIIAFNGGAGVAVESFFAGNPIRFNSIHDNAGLGIDLNNDGFTPNDPGDADTGGNDLQNFPDLSSAVVVNGVATISGLLDTLPGDYFVDVYGNTSADAEGETYLGTQTVTVTSGAQSFSLTVPLPAGERYITATATAMAPPPRDTSEFSPAIAAQFPPTVTTAASPGVPVGGQVFDTATLSGDFTPPGTLVFYLYGPDDATCATTPVITSADVIASQTVYSSPPVTVTQAGTYRWVVEYVEGEAILFRSGCNDQGEEVVVTQAGPALTTQASPPVTVGGAVTDTATLTGGFNPTGLVTFFLFGPDDPTCTTTAVFTSTKGVDGNGPVTSDSFTPTAPGVYRWVASYTGDANNAPANAPCNAANETVTVATIPTTTTSTTSTTTTLPPTTTTTLPPTTTSTLPPTTTTSTSTTSTTTTLPPTTTTTSTSTSTSTTSTSTSTTTTRPPTTTTTTRPPSTTTSTIGSSTTTTSTTTTTTTVPPTTTTTVPVTTTTTTSTTTTSTTTTSTTTTSTTTTTVPPIPPTGTTTVPPPVVTVPVTTVPPTTLPPTTVPATTTLPTTTLPTTTLPPTTVGPTTSVAPTTTSTTAPPGASLDAINPEGERRGPPGVALDVSGGGYTGCETVYFFFDGVRIGTDKPDANGNVGVGNLSVPGDAKPGEHRVTSACRPSGGPLKASSAFIVTDAAIHRSAFATSLPQPDQVSLNLETVAASALAAVGILLLFAFPFELFNSTIEENYDEIRGWFHLPPRLVGAGTRAGRIVTFFGLTVLTAVIVGFLSPDFGLNMHSLVLVVGFTVALMVMSLGFSLPADIGIHRKTGEWGTLNFLPGTVAVAAVMVLISRLMHFQPGYMYGALAGLAFASALTRADQGRLTAANWLWALALSVGAWFLRIPVSHAAAMPHASVWWIGVEAGLVMIVLWGVESLVVAMLPMRFLDGRKVLDWNRVVWAVLLFLGVFATVQVLLAPNSGYVGHTTGGVTIGVIVLFLIFGAISVGTWAYFRFRPTKWIPRGH